MKPIIIFGIACLAATGGAFADEFPVPHVDAVEVAEDIYSLGYAFQDGQIVEGYAFVNRGAKKDSLKHNKQEKLCYNFIAEGAKWKSPERWYLNPFNDEGLDPIAVVNILVSCTEKWEIAADADIFRGRSVFLTSAPLSADFHSPDGINEVYFGYYPNPSVVAITVIWGVFDTKVKYRRIVEWDQIYNTAWPWSTNGDPAKFDFEAVVTHELGHAAGMGHVFCQNQTMYPYISPGDTGMRTLGEGDARGIWKLYKGPDSVPLE